jgi:hypothetical protein
MPGMPMQGMNKAWARCTRPALRGMVTASLLLATVLPFAVLGQTTATPEDEYKKLNHMRLPMN